MTKQTPFLLGVNYWPRKKAMYWWKDFDRCEVENEFAEIAALKLKVVRIFLTWEDFQPAPDRISEEAVANLGIVLDTAQALGLQVQPTLFTGFMSGISWWPAWALAEKGENPWGAPRLVDGKFTHRAGRDPYTDPLMLAAQTLQVRTLSERYGQHPALFGWDWGNEHDNFYRPESYADGFAWSRLLATEVKRFSDAPVATGQHFPMLLAYTGFRADQQALVNDIQIMHGYSIYYSLVSDTDPLNSDMVPLACLVTEALGGRPVLFQEFGYASSPDGKMSEFHEFNRQAAADLQLDAASIPMRQYLADDAAGGRYYREVLEKLARCGALGAWAWNFSDYDACIWHLPPFNTHEYERCFGLTRTDGSVKPSGEAMRSFAERLAEGEPLKRTVAPLQLDADAWYANPEGQFDRVFQQWRGKI